MDQAPRAVDNIIKRFRRGQARKDDIGLRADLSRRTRGNAANFLEFGERAAAITDNAMAALDQIVGNRQADLADANDANRLHGPPRFGAHDALLIHATSTD